MNVNSLFLRLPADVARADAMESISAQLRERQSILAVGSYVLAAHRDQWFEVRCPEGDPGPLGASAGALGSTIYALGSALSRGWQVETVVLSTDGAFLAFEHNAPGRRSRGLGYQPSAGWISATGVPLEWERSVFFSKSDLKAALATVSWFGGGPIKTAYGFSEIKLDHRFPFPPNRELGARIMQAAGLPTEEPLETRELRLPSGKHVEIITTPPGDAPVEMREAWVGLRLPVVDDASAGVVLVDREDALSRLFARSPPASMFFRMRPEPAWGTGVLMSLPAELCRISGGL